MDAFTCIKNSELFAKLGEAEISLIIDRSEQIAFAAGERVFLEGDPGDGVYFVLDGSMNVSKTFAGVSRELAVLGAGECFGEISLVADGQRTATVCAREPARCLKLSTAEFDLLLADNSHFSHKLMRILSARLLNTERAADEQLIHAYQTLIFSLADLAESRDPETGAHLLRVQNYCRLLATRAAGHPHFAAAIDQRFIDDIYVTSPLHDIGKVGIPDAVLLKPGKLTEAEFAVMKTHAAIGGKTLMGVLAKLENSTFRVAHRVVLYHHEKFDGSGYPRGLQGEQIPLEARIMALADVYDALLSKRVYKDAFEHDAAVAIIRDGRGRHFDPLLTDLMLEHIAQFQAIYRQFAD